MLIFIAEPDQDLRLGLQMLLHQEGGLHVIGMAVQARGLFVQLEASRVDVLLLDWHLPGASMPELLNELIGLEYPPKIVVLSVKPEEEAPALAAGADRFVSKAAPPDDLIDVIRTLK